MKVFAIVSLVTFFLVKSTIYILGFSSRRGYVTDYGHILTIVLPIMSFVTYVGCFYMLGDKEIGFATAIAISWFILVVSIIIIKYLHYASVYIIAENNYDCFNVAKSIIMYLRRKDKDIIFSDNIGVSNYIKITFDRKKFSRKEMCNLIDAQLYKFEVPNKIHKISLLGLLIHIVELIFDVSFLAIISMQ